MNATLTAIFTRWLFWVGLLALTLSGCNPNGTPVPTNIPIQVTATLVSTNATPSATTAPTLPSVPLAAIVNGWVVTLAEYEVELALYRATLPADDTEQAANAAQYVLDNLIDQALLAQAAWQAGYRVDDATLQARIDALSAQLGDAQALADWMVTYGYTDETFRWTLRRSMAAAWMRDQLINTVPTITEQIHVRQILLYNSDQANSVLLQLKNGADFTVLAFQYDPATGGDLGWFPRGYLTTPEVEAAAFALRADQFSEVVASPLGYHIVQVIAIESQRPVEPAARLILQEQSLLHWITEQRTQAQIDIRMPRE